MDFIFLPRRFCLCNLTTEFLSHPSIYKGHETGVLHTHLIKDLQFSFSLVSVRCRRFVNPVSQIVYKCSLFCTNVSLSSCLFSQRSIIQALYILCSAAIVFLTCNGKIEWSPQVFFAKHLQQFSVLHRCTAF